MRVSWVDYAKGIGIVLVVYGHVMRGLHDAGVGMPSHFFRLSDTFVYGFHMPLFFFLSGMFAEKWASRRPLTAFAQKAGSLLYPYAVWSLIQGAVVIVLSDYTNAGDNGVTKNTLIGHILWDPHGQFWFLYVLFFVFVLYYACKRFLNKRALFVLSLVFFASLPILPDVWVTGRLATHLAYFMLGAVAYGNGNGVLDRFLKLRGNLALSATVFLVVNTAYLPVYDKLWALPLQFAQFVVAAAGIAFIASVSASLSKLGARWISVIGSLSMSIYLMHILAASGTRILLIRFFHADNLILQAVLGVTVGVLAPIVGHALFQKARLSKLLFAEKSRSFSLKGDVS